MTTIELPYVTISFDTPIVYYHYKEGAELGFPEMKELIANAEKLSWSRPYFTYSDVSVKMSVTPEGKRYIADLRHLPFFRGAAVVVKSGMLSYAINFMNYFQKQKYPFKAFADKQQALRWLMSLPVDSNMENGWSLM